MERADADKKMRKLNFTLLLERTAHQKRIQNPIGARPGPTPVEIQPQLAEENKKKVEEDSEEHRR
jgi:hypothetical protein